MPTKKLREFLDGQGIPYVAISHAVAYTAKEIAALRHISNKELAKTVIVKVDRALAMAVLPASYEVDLSLLRAATGARSVSLAKESEFKDRFPECEIGAMPPFGNLYGMAVYVDESLTKDKDIIQCWLPQRIASTLLRRLRTAGESEGPEVFRPSGCGVAWSLAPLTLESLLFCIRLRPVRVL